MPDRFHNYDVLLMPSAIGEPLRFTPGNHVGNQRFRVLLSISRQRYLQADLFGHEHDCVSIVEEVLETVCNKCVPNGRFFEKLGNQWKKIGHGSLSTLVMNALKNEPVETISLERGPKRVCRRSPGFELLCQAASTLHESHVAPPNPFDVICAANGLGISLVKDCNHTGNNRLKILFDIRKKSYETSKQEGKQRIVQELVSSIIDDASGHFLEVDKPSGKYREMSRELATSCVTIALDAAIEGEKRQFRQSEVKKLVLRKHKKALLDRHENRISKNCGVGFLFHSAPSKAFKTARGVASKAA